MRLAHYLKKNKNLNLYWMGIRQNVPIKERRNENTWGRRRTSTSTWISSSWFCRTLQQVFLAELLSQAVVDWQYFFSVSKKKALFSENAQSLIYWFGIDRTTYFLTSKVSYTRRFRKRSGFRKAKTYRSWVQILEINVRT